MFTYLDLPLQSHFELGYSFVDIRVKMPKHALRQRYGLEEFVLWASNASKNNVFLMFDKTLLWASGFSCKVRNGKVTRAS